MDNFQFLRSPVAAAREWWYTNVWKDSPDEDDEDMEDHLKDLADDSSSQFSQNVVNLKVGIHCEECKRIVADALWCMQGVDRVDVDRFTGKVSVTGKVTTKRVLRTVRRTGKCVELWNSKRDSSSESHNNNTGSSSSSAAVATIGDEDEEDGLCTIM